MVLGRSDYKRMFEGGSSEAPNPYQQAFNGEEVDLGEQGNFEFMEEEDIGELDHDQMVFIDHLRVYSHDQKQRLIAIELRTHWDSIFWTNSLMMNAAVALYLSMLWMIVVNANLDLVLITICMCVYLVAKYLSSLLAGLLNDRSQFAKVFLVGAQIFGIVAAILLIYSSNYGVEKDKSAAATQGAQMQAGAALYSQPVVLANATNATA